MRGNDIIVHLKRPVTRMLLAAIIVFIPHQPMWGEAIDSLYRVFVNADNSKRVEVVNSLSRQLHNGGVIDTLYLCDPSLKAESLEAMMHYLMAEQYYDTEQYESARQEGEKARSLMDMKKPNKFQSDVLGVLSSAQYRIGDYEEALKTLLEVYKIDKKLNNQELISSDLNTLAAIYLAVEQPGPGLQFIEKAISIERSCNHPDHLATRLGMASELYLLNHEPDKAMAAIKEAYQLDKQGGRAEKAAVRMVQMGTVMINLGKLDEAQSIIERALPQLEKSNATYSLAVAYNQLGDILNQQGKPQEATAFFKMALENSIKCGSPKIERVAEHGLWETMRESNPRGAMMHLERYAVLNDSIMHEMTATSMKVMEVTNNTIEQAEKDQQNKAYFKLFNLAGSALLVMLVALLVGLFYSRRKTKNALKIQKQAQELRTHFLNNITNELQTPLSVVMGAGQQLVDNGGNDENKRLGHMIVDHGKSMLDLVNQLLDIEQVRSAIEQPDYKRGNIVLFVKMLVDNFHDKAQEKLINLEFRSPVNSMNVVFTPEYIRKIVISLIDNAIKFTPRNGSITVTLMSPETGKMRIIVSDTGVGIPVEERSRIFEPLYQKDNGDDDVNTALGLSLVNQVVQAMNGSIHVDSQLGQGTTFTIDFPIPNENTANKSATPEDQHIVEEHIRQSGNNAYKPLVFIVENNEDISFFIASHLNKAYNLRFARDGQEALQNAQDMVPDLVITDMIMPVMDGKKLIQQLRANSTLSHIPIIALTNIPSEKERMSCIEAGADAVLVKPFNSDELRLLTGHLIKQRNMLRERYMKSDNSVNDKTQVKKMSKEDKEFINKLIDIIPAHMAKGNVDMDNIAAAMSLSRKQLRERITAIMGMTPIAFVLQVRLNYASNLIVSDDTPLTTIAQRCGFNNLSHFSKMFKQQFGVSPQQYRKSHNDMNLINNPRMNNP